MIPVSDVKVLEEFVEIVDRTSSAPEFMIETVVAGLGFMSTRRFFRDSIFPFLFSPSMATRGVPLRIKIRLNGELAKLQSLYEGLPRDCWQPT